MLTPEVLHELKKLAYQEEEGHSPQHGTSGPVTIDAHNELIQAGYARTTLRRTEMQGDTALLSVVVVTEKGKALLKQINNV